MASAEAVSTEVVSTDERRVYTGVDSRIPTLDGWRGIAVLFVLIWHAQCGLIGHAIYPWMNLGQHGVTIFFVLSGYLITSKLRSERRIDLRRFYLRRFFRLMPVAWCYLAAIFLLGLTLHIQIIGRDAWYCLLFVRNSLNEGSWNGMTAHFWSLSIEEQFYLTWPILLVVLGRRGAPWAAIGGIVVCTAFRAAYPDYYNHTFLGVHSQVRMDALLVGCLLALSVERLIIRHWLVRYARPISYLALPLLLLHMWRYQDPTPLSESIVIAAMIASTSLAPRSVMGRLLEYRHLKFLGVLSYSLYMWQEIFLVPHWGGLAYVMIALLPPAAIGSYGLIERPSIRLGRRLEARVLRGPQRSTLTLTPESSPA